MTCHPVAVIHQSLDKGTGDPGFTRGGLIPARPSRAGPHTVKLGQEQSDRPVRAGILGALDVAFQQVLDLLLPPPALGRVRRAFGVQAEEDGVAAGEEFLDRLLRAER